MTLEELQKIAQVMVPNGLPTGIELIVEERLRQISEEGWTLEHDDSHDRQEIALAAACYAAGAPIKIEVLRSDIPNLILPHWAWVEAWPWDKKWDKRKKHPRLRQLVIAGALIAAEIDRLQRLESPPTRKPGEVPSKTVFGALKQPGNK